MQVALIHALRLRRADIEARWSELIHAERAGTPLANPDVLASMIDWTLEEIFRMLEAPSGDRPSRRHQSLSGFECSCGRNPLLAYFAAGEQSMQEALAQCLASRGAVHPLERATALAELNQVLHDAGRREFQAFCAVCDHQHAAQDVAELTLSPA